MMGLELVVSVEHFNADSWAESEEYRTRYPAKVVAARMVDGLKLLRYAKEATFKTEERRCLYIASGECDGDHAPASARTFLSKDEVVHGISRSCSTCSTCGSSSWSWSAVLWRTHRIV